MKTTLLAITYTLLSLTISLPSQARTWTNGKELVSDTCVTKSGVVFVFSNLVKPVGSPCSFKLDGDATFYSGWFG